jgi:tetratricopeptide (TPR) repeat protein
MTSSDRRFEEALTHYRQAHYSAAIRIWKALLDEGYPNPNLGLYLWAAQSEYGRMLDSVSQFAESLAPGAEVVPEPDELAEARQALDARKPREALALLQKAIALTPGALRPRLLAAQAALKCGLLGEALESARIALETGPTDPEAHAVLGQVHLESGQLGRAAAAFRKALAISDKAASAWHGLAMTSYRERWLAEAERCLGQAMACSTQLSTTQPLMEEIRRERRRAEARLEESRAKIAENPHYADWHFRRGTLAASLGLDDEASAALDAALEVNPQMPKAWQDKARMALHAGRHAQACAALRQAVALASESNAEFCRQAEALEQTGRYEEAAERLMQALRLVPDYASRHIETGKKLYTDGLPDEAERALTRGVSLAPHYPDGHHFLGRIALDRGQSAEAIGRFKTALSLNPQYAEAALRLIEALLQDGNPAGARHTLEQWRSRLEDDPRLGAWFRTLEKRASEQEEGSSQRRARKRSEGKSGKAKAPRRKPAGRKPGP